MNKGEQTRQSILQKVAVLFNEKGYCATSMQDITAATGIQRGGIYNHFASKEALALESFEYTVAVLAQRLQQGVRCQPPGLKRLKAIATTFAELYTENPLFPCGCQVLNTAVEAKRHLLPLRGKAQVAMLQFKDLIMTTTLASMKRGELAATLDSDQMATVFISTLEGAMMLSVLFDDTSYLHQAVAHLHEYVDHLAATSQPPTSP